jgi:hypothetical protein
VAVGGGWGTLAEIAFALRAGVPVIGLDTWEPARRGRPEPGIVAADNAEAAVSEALRRAPGRGVGPRGS